MDILEDKVNEAKTKLEHLVEKATDEAGNLSEDALKKLGDSKSQL